MVLVKNVGLKGKHKLADRWQKDPYRVVQHPNPDLPVYRIGREGEKTKLLHRNMLLPLSLPQVEEDPEMNSDPNQSREIIPPHRPVDRMESSAEAYSDEETDEHISGNVDEDDFLRIHVPEVTDDHEPEAADFSDERTLRSDLFIPGESDTAEQVVLQDQPLAEPAQTAPQDALPEAPFEVPHETRFEDPQETPYEDTQEIPYEDTQEARTLRRSQRTRRPPDFYVSSAHTATVTDWRDRVSILLYMMQVCPSMSDNICVTIVDVIKNCP
jgi:hypothetical protein